MSDVFGSLVKQWSLNQTAAEADWLIGAEVFTPGVEADALRSMKAPGKAYDNDTFGKDPQPDHMSKFVHLPDTDEGDNGGVHINSGIPNKAFYLTATDIGGFAWEAPGHIWYEALKASSAETDFQQFADTTFAKAGALVWQRQRRAAGGAKSVARGGYQNQRDDAGRRRGWPGARSAGRGSRGGQLGRADQADRDAVRPSEHIGQGCRRAEEKGVTILFLSTTYLPMS